MQNEKGGIPKPAMALTGEALNFVLYLPSEIRRSRCRAAPKAVAGL
jgi:hypothetical protein